MTIEPPRWGLVVMVAWIGLLCLVMVAGAVNEHDPRGLFLVFIWLPWLVPVVLIARIRLSAVGDVLTYRGLLRTRVWRRDEIDCFEIVESNWSPDVGRIQMRTVGGQWVVLGIASARRRHATRLAGWLTELQDWQSAADLADLA